MSRDQISVYVHVEGCYPYYFMGALSHSLPYSLSFTCMARTGEGIIKKVKEKILAYVGDSYCVAHLGVVATSGDKEIYRNRVILTLNKHRR